MRGWIESHTRNRPRTARASTVHAPTGSQIVKTPALPSSCNHSTVVSIFVLEFVDEPDQLAPLLFRQVFAPDECLYKRQWRATEDFRQQITHQASAHLLWWPRRRVDERRTMLLEPEVSLLGKILHHRHHRGVRHLPFFEHPFPHVRHRSAAQLPHVVQHLHLRLSERRYRTFTHGVFPFCSNCYFNSTSLIVVLSRDTTN